MFDLNADAAREHMLKSASYFDITLPPYFNFGPILNAAFEIAKHTGLKEIRNWKPQDCSGVNYTFLSNKDGKFSWRPFELINPLIYAKSVHLLTEPNAWKLTQNRLKSFSGGIVECCSLPVVATGVMSDIAEQILMWWHKIEQRSLELSFEYSHVAVTDVTNCYPSIYTHSISWAFHDRPFIKSGNNRNKDNLIGNRLDRLIQISREGQTNGIPQASILSHVLAELIMGYCDKGINERLKDSNISILRYRDDYRIFGMSDADCNEALKVVSEELLIFGMRLGAAKTSESSNLVSAAVKREKVDALGLQVAQKTLQKELLVIHNFALENPNTGALKVLLKTHILEIERQIKKDRYEFENKKVLVAILLDLAAISPNVLPAIARAVSLILDKMQPEERNELFRLVLKKAERIPNSGYFEIWLQRMALPNGIAFQPTDALCNSVLADSANLWNFDWIEDEKVKATLSNFSVVDRSQVDEVTPVIKEEEIDDFWKDNPS
ncbi:RNA-directed DNA polymerase [Sulfitobacter aestuariivivens]|uniref:RNA-directed DNA polymerase n=1 Tax=Sulfitobacter aestuariivivens TaxID=2766981 RepID=UPI0036121F39